MCIRYQQFSTSTIISSLIATNITANQERSTLKYDVYPKTCWLPFSGFIDSMKSSEMNLEHDFNKRNGCIVNSYG